MLGFALPVSQELEGRKEGGRKNLNEVFSQLRMHGVLGTTGAPGQGFRQR